MKKIVIKNWRQYGDYLLFSGMVDTVKQWIMLQAINDEIIVIGKEDSINKYCQLLKSKNIKYDKLLN